MKLQEDPETMASQLATLALRFEVFFLFEPGHFRLAAFFPRAEGPAFFGFWDSQPDAEINQIGFAALRDLAARRGIRQLLGPVNGATFFRYRVRLGHTPV